MNARTVLLVLFTATLAGMTGWFAARRPIGPTPASADRRVLFYQSAMHPWIRSDTPGKCTICGMELTPVFEGESGLDSDSGTVTLSSNGATVLHVRSDDIRRGELVRTLRVAGTIENDDTRFRILSAYVGGRIEELYVNYVGAEVVAGQPLARFFSPVLLEAERQFLAVARSLPSGLSNAEAPDLLRAAAAARLRQLGLSDAQIAALPVKNPTNHFSDILAPANGTVVNRFVYAGQYVMEGEKLFELADFSTMWFLFDAYEQDLPWIRPGQEIEVTTPSIPDRSFRAPIRFIDPNLVATTRSTKVRVEIPNPIVNDADSPRRLLRNRTYAEGRVRVTIPNVVLIPRSAVLSPAGEPMVYLDQGGGGYTQRRIHLGRLGDDAYEVTGGLSPGDRVVVAGNLMIDAQAQLNQTLAALPSTTSPPPATAPDSPAATLPPLTPAQTAATLEFLRRADALGSALANDDLAAFNTAASSLPDHVQSWLPTLTGASDWQLLTHEIASHGRLGAAPDLRSARKTYHPFAVALVDLARALRSAQPEFKDLKIYRCPMTAEAFDDAPSRAQWLQLSPPLRNPWFGAEMLECGVEVRP